MPQHGAVQFVEKIEMPGNGYDRIPPRAMVAAGAEATHNLNKKKTMNTGSKIIRKSALP